jgi:hypothetical protein
MAKEYTTVWIENDVLERLKNATIDFYWMPATSSSDKIRALILLYEDNYKKPINK